MAAPTVTYTFTNGTVASGPNVSTNFSDIIAALTDGTKSFSIDALTCAGTTTLNGAVALGNATGDDVTITGYVASAIIPKTDNTYALGDTSHTWSAIYLGDGTESLPSLTNGGDVNTGIYFSAADEVSIAVGGVRQVSIKASGELLLGKVATNSATLSSDDDLRFIIDRNNDGTTGNFYFQKHDTSGANNLMTLMESGNLGIGIAAPLAPLHVSASIADNWLSIIQNTNASPYGTRMYHNTASDNNTNKFLQAEDATALRCIIYSDGDLQNHDNSYGAISDERLKQDIVDATSQIDDIKKLKIRKYRFKTDVEANPGCSAHIGVIAQELVQTSPGLVSYDEKEDTYSVQYSILYMKAVKALQETIFKVEELSAKLTALEARL